jgi:hypothetical protein
MRGSVARISGPSGARGRDLTAPIMPQPDAAVAGSGGAT